MGEWDENWGQCRLPVFISRQGVQEGEAGEDEAGDGAQRQGKQGDYKGLKLVVGDLLNPLCFP